MPTVPVLMDGVVIQIDLDQPNDTTLVHYIPVALVRERLEAAGKWGAVVALLDMAMVLKLATLRYGIDPADTEVRALLTAVGASPDAILAP